MRTPAWDLFAGRDLIEKVCGMRWQMKSARATSAAAGGQVTPSAPLLPSSKALHRHRVRRFHHHPAALGHGFFFGQESPSNEQEPARTTDEPNPAVPPENPENKNTRRAARNGMWVCVAILALPLLFLFLVMLYYRFGPPILQPNPSVPGQFLKRGQD